MGGLKAAIWKGVPAVMEFTALKSARSFQFQHLGTWFWCLLESLPQLNKLKVVSHRKGELPSVPKLRLQLTYDEWRLYQKILGIIFLSKNSDIIIKKKDSNYFSFS